MCARPRRQLLLASRWPPKRSEASAAKCLGLGPAKAPRSCSENIVFHKENQRFHVLSYYDGSSIDTKMCTPLGPEHDFRNDGLKPEQVMLPKACFLQEKLKI